MPEGLTVARLLDYLSGGAVGTQPKPRLTAEETAQLQRERETGVLGRRATTTRRTTRKTLMLASVGGCYINHMVRYLQFKRVMVNQVKAKVMSSFRLLGELEVIDKIHIRTTVRAAPRYKDVVEKAFKVAQAECTLLMILDIEKEFELVFEPGEERS